MPTKAPKYGIRSKRMLRLLWEPRQRSPNLDSTRILQRLGMRNSWRSLMTKSSSTLSLAPKKVATSSLTSRSTPIATRSNSTKTAVKRNLSKCRIKYQTSPRILSTYLWLISSSTRPTLALRSTPNSRLLVSPLTWQHSLRTLTCSNRQTSCKCRAIRALRGTSEWKT